MPTVISTNQYSEKMITTSNLPTIITDQFTLIEHSLSNKSCMYLVCCHIRSEGVKPRPPNSAPLLTQPIQFYSNTALHN